MGRKNIIGLIICIAILALLKVNYVACIDADRVRRTDTRPKDIIEAEHEASNELNILTANMFDIIEKENIFKQAYLDNSLKVSNEDVEILGNIIYNESRGESKLVQSCIAWTVLNHCDNNSKTIKYEANYPNRFAYKPNMQLKSKAAKKVLAQCEEIAKDVIIRHMCEQDGVEQVGRTLPNNYYSYWGDGKHSHFRTTVGVYEYWDYSLGNPY